MCACPHGASGIPSQTRAKCRSHHGQRQGIVMPVWLSRDSPLGQRKRPAFAVQCIDGLMDGAVECVGIGEGLMREMVRLEVAPDALDVIEFRCIFGQPLDREPVSAFGKRRAGELAGVDRSIVLDQHHRLGGLARFGAIEPVELLKMSDEVAAALGLAGVHDELAGDMVERAQHRDFPCLSWGGNPEVRPCLGPGAGEIGVRQCLALVAIEQNDVAGFGLLFAKLQAQPDPVDLGGNLAAFQRVSRTPPAELFLRKALDNCERLMRTPARASISLHSRGIVQLTRSATGSANSGRATRNAVSLFIGAGPDATVAFSASTPPVMKSLRHSRTVSSRTPNASAIRGLVQPASVNSTARARSASPRSREPARTLRALCCASVAKSGDFPLMSAPANRVPTQNQTLNRWSTSRNLLRSEGRCVVALATSPPASATPMSTMFPLCALANT